MKIKSLKLKNHQILGDIEIDFTDENGKVIDTVIFAGENGCGKTTILNVIYQLASKNNPILQNGEEWIVIVELTDDLFNQLQSAPAQTLINKTTQNYEAKNRLKRCEHAVLRRPNRSVLHK